MALPPPDPKILIDALLVAFDLFGTFVFALSGGIAALKHRLDLFGVLVLSFAAATFGGIMRDVLIGAVPPASLQDWRYLAVSILAGVVTLVWNARLARLQNAVLIFDAAGLGLFAVAGAGKALAYHLGPVPAALLGMLTGIGGGLVRDLLVAEVPAVLRRDVYAVAALAGASVLVGGEALHLPSNLVAVLGASLCFAIRMLAIYRHWSFPVVRLPEPPTN
ncbi:MAG: trimeric intracellular cation channel family protein [Acidobacteriota bacterium]